MKGSRCSYDKCEISLKGGREPAGSGNGRSPLYPGYCCTNAGGGIERNELKRLSAFVNKITNKDIVANDIIEIYLREVMRLLVNVAQTRNVIVVITNSDQNLQTRKSWTNAIDHRIHLAKVHDWSQFKLSNSRSTVCRVNILKTIHNTCRIGHSIPYAISNEGLFAIRMLKNGSLEDAKQGIGTKIEYH